MCADDSPPGRGNGGGDVQRDVPSSHRSQNTSPRPLPITVLALGSALIILSQASVAHYTNGAPRQAAAAGRAARPVHRVVQRGADRASGAAPINSDGPAAAAALSPPPLGRLSLTRALAPTRASRTETASSTLPPSTSA